LLAVGSQGDVGPDRVDELCRLAAHASHEGPARHHGRVLGPGGPADHQLRLPGRKHVPLRPAFLRRTVSREVKGVCSYRPLFLRTRTFFAVWGPSLGSDHDLSHRTT